MKKYSILLLIFTFAAGAFAQKDNKQKQSEKEKPIIASVAVSKTSTPLELAKAALAAHGGDKFKNMKSLVIIGTADVAGSPTMTFPAPFVMTFSGEKYRLEISTPFMQLKQIYDGQQTYSSIPNFSLPPLNRLGLPLLPKIEEKGFTVSSLPEKNKKLGFRITSPEGYFTDFFLDEKTAQVKSYGAKYDYNGREITTSVEIDKLRNVEGVLIAERYAQRFEVGQNTIYTNFKAKEISVNTPVADDVFIMK